MSKEPRLKKHQGWVRGAHMPEFSGKSWQELEDIWPAEVRISSEAWKILSVVIPASEATREFCRGYMPELTNQKKRVQFGMREILWLAWIQRCEEAASNTFIDPWPIKKGFNIQDNKLFNNRKSVLTKLGLIENMPAPGIRLYRVTGRGKVVLNKFVSELEQAHYNLRAWRADKPKENCDMITEYLNKYCTGWEEVTEIEEQNKPK